MRLNKSPIPGKERQRKYRHKLRMELLNKLGGKCVRCGFSDWRALQIDHIHGGGKAERKTFNGIYSFRLYLRKLPLGELRAKYQCLCANCNRIKYLEDELSYAAK